MSKKSLSPMFKWTGGKRREIERIAPYFPKMVTDGEPWQFIEPFVGGGALYFYFNNPNSVINDWDNELINFYRVVAKKDKSFVKALKDISALFDKETLDGHAKQEQAFYEWRNLDRADGGLGSFPDWKRAVRFFVTTQLAFAGMRRFNAAGQFNVPFGHYKNFNVSAVSSKDHIDLLKSSTIMNGGYEEAIEGRDNPRTFIFVDPPYTRVMKKYSSDSDFGEDSQRALAAKLISLENASWMVVIDKSDLTMELYGNHILGEYPVSYGVNIRNRFDQGAVHIVAGNYKV